MNTLKDVLHFYLGCDVFIIDPKDGESQVRKLMGVDNTWANPLRLQLGEYISAFNYDEVKPLLRPLSDMTEDEKEKAASYADSLRDEYTAACAMAGTVQYLLSKHFDLFGLIESNQAIDKTKQGK